MWDHYLSEEGRFRPCFQKEELRQGSEATESTTKQFILPEVITWTVTTKDTVTYCTRTLSESIRKCPPHS